MTATTAYSAQAPGAELQPTEVDLGPLDPLAVEIDVTHMGVCRSDIGRIDNEYGLDDFPLVAGHEAVGVVRAVGTAVDTEQIFLGQRVGIGAIGGSCFACEWCLSGRHQLCPHRDDVILRGMRGAFTTVLRASDWRHVQPIPEAISSAEAAPLMCAGSTVFPQLTRLGIRATDRVAVVGIGGLGHLALQFLSAWGAAVTAISSSADKAEDARGFGAQGFLDSSDSKAMAGAAGSFDFVISTVSGNLDWNAYLALVRPAGTLALLGLPTRTIEIDPMALLPAAKRIVGAIPAGPTENARMLEFAARTGVRPLIQTYPLERIDDALAAVRSGSVRYRAVLERAVR
jgi:uncharacterized zinc-type alcohol dehydrogenase-like protein